MDPATCSITKLTTPLIHKVRCFLSIHADVDVGFSQLVRYCVERDSDAFLMLHPGSDGEAEVIGVIAGRFSSEVLASSDELAHNNIDILCVHTAYRRLGLAQRLIATFIETRATQAGCALEVRRSNGAAQNLYRRLGFHEKGVKPRFYTNEDAVVMHLAA